MQPKWLTFISTVTIFWITDLDKENESVSILKIYFLLDQTISKQQQQQQQNAFYEGYVYFTAMHATFAAPMKQRKN